MIFRQLTLLVLLGLVTLQSCETIDKNFEVINDKLEVGYHGNYKDSIQISYHAERGVMMRVVPPTVKRIGHNGKYLIVEREKSNLADTAMILYYILNMELFKIPDPQTTEKIIHGPLDYANFIETKRQLKIEPLDFDQEF